MFLFFCFFFVLLKSSGGHLWVIPAQFSEGCCHALSDFALIWFRGTSLGETGTFQTKNSNSILLRFLRPAAWKSKFPYLGGPNCHLVPMNADVEDFDEPPYPLKKFQKFFFHLACNIWLVNITLLRKNIKYEARFWFYSPPKMARATKFEGL